MEKIKVQEGMVSWLSINKGLYYGSTHIYQDWGRIVLGAVQTQKKRQSLP